MKKHSVAVIGSFKKHNDSVQRVCVAVRAAGFTITSPLGSEIVEHGIDFVRFESDATDLSDADVQSLALNRIFAADLVYVVAPKGYVGNTTCYEIGRIIQRRQPIYFSSQPVDLPLYVPPSFVLHHVLLLQEMNSMDWQPAWLFQNDSSPVSISERGLLAGIVRDE